MRTAWIGLALAAALFPATAALAHAHLVSASPAADSVAKPAPRRLRLAFSETVTQAFTGASVAAATGAPIRAGPASLDPADGKVLIVPLAQPLAPGAYVVSWHAVAADAHRSTGQYSFTVAP